MEEDEDEDEGAADTAVAATPISAAVLGLGLLPSRLPLLSEEMLPAPTAAAAPAGKGGPVGEPRRPPAL